MSKKLNKWNDAYQQADIANAKAAQVIKDHVYLLSESGSHALDLACGRAGNAILLASLGYKVDAVDFSPVVLDQVEQFAKVHNLSINCQLRDIENDGLTSQKYDVIVVSYFLNRKLFPQIIKALNPDGLLFYQTWSQLRCDDSGPGNMAFRLETGELLQLTAPLRTVFYEENGQLGDTSKGLRNEAMLIAQNS